jgi:hypothetical protein
MSNLDNAQISIRSSFLATIYPFPVLFTPLHRTFNYSLITSSCLKNLDTFLPHDMVRPTLVLQLTVGKDLVRVFRVVREGDQHHVAEYTVKGESRGLSR